MTAADDAERINFEGGGGATISALLQRSPQPRALYVMAHGAGANMEHSFMRSMAVLLAQHSIATLRYNFPYMELGRGRPDQKPVLHDTVRAAVDLAARLMPGVQLFAGGKSMGGRMTSEAQSGTPLTGVRGLVFLGFPLHPPKRPAVERAAHLAAVNVPSLFLQGTRDDLADLDLMRGVTTSLGERATLHVIDGADHSFHVLKRSGRDDAAVLGELAVTIAAWIDTLPS